MACRTCDHTMQGLGEVTGGIGYFWCPRCGTLKSEYRDEDESREEWESPRAWRWAIDVLQQLVDGPDTDTNVLVCQNSARKILRDCEPERKEKPWVRLGRSRL